jgi:hypothetical protein
MEMIRACCQGRRAGETCRTLPLLALFPQDFASNRQGVVSRLQHFGADQAALHIRNAVHRHPSNILSKLACSRYVFHYDEVAEAEAQGLPYVLVPRVLRLESNRRELEAIQGSSLRAPIRPNRAWKALGVIGPSRSVIKACEDGPCSRCRRRSARISSPCIRWTLGAPAFRTNYGA